MRALLLIALTIAASCSAQPVADAPWVTGERLVKLQGNVDPASVRWNPDGPFRSKAFAAEYADMTNKEFVRGYIQGVHDATEGKSWCWSPKFGPVPDELEADIRNRLPGMVDYQLKRNAAELIVGVWNGSFPCGRAIGSSRQGPSPRLGVEK